MLAFVFPGWVIILAFLPVILVLVRSIMESNLPSPKHQKHLNSSGTVKPTEQEKLSLKRECEQFQRRSPTNRKIEFLSYYPWLC